MMKPMGYANLQVSEHKLGTNKNHIISIIFKNSISFVFFNVQYFYQWIKQLKFTLIKTNNVFKKYQYIEKDSWTYLNH